MEAADHDAGKLLSGLVTYNDGRGARPYLMLGRLREGTSSRLRVFLGGGERSATRLSVILRSSSWTLDDTTELSVLESGAYSFEKG